MTEILFKQQHQQHYVSQKEEKSLALDFITHCITMSMIYKRIAIKSPMNKRKQNNLVFRLDKEQILYIEHWHIQHGKQKCINNKICRQPPLLIPVTVAVHPTA